MPRIEYTYSPQHIGHNFYFPFLPPQIHTKIARIPAIDIEKLKTIITQTMDKYSQHLGKSTLLTKETLPTEKASWVMNGLIFQSESALWGLVFEIADEDEEELYLSDHFLSPHRDAATRIIFSWDPEAGFAETWIREMMEEFYNLAHKEKEAQLEEYGIIRQLHAIKKYGAKAEYKKRKLKPMAFIPENYEKAVADQFDGLIQFLKDGETSGICLFHGDPGTGKTKYIEALCSQLQDKHNVYNFSPRVVASIVDQPSLIDDLVKEGEQVIFILEDAEKVLLSREVSEGSVTSALLNLIDGIAGQSSAVKIICTVNTEEKNIDKALLRAGRLKFNLNFKELPATQATAISARLRFNITFKKSASLAEVYNPTAPEKQLGTSKKELGFA